MFRCDSARELPIMAPPSDIQDDSLGRLTKVCPSRDMRTSHAAHNAAEEHLTLTQYPLRASADQSHQATSEAQPSTSSPTSSGARDSPEGASLGRR
ncbi:hypothetical protein BDW42DRAFT_158504 [Aspergillus taichungensis]|uniref:Uncharacterized protein n=1 Tax=Aspergillus taichungensis TaxID=482145 RepID=A0A2J5I8T1_9EURO|nr:hypothetical protein BDW42DRAFT_158504 [Aspergillus taichungensis]